MPLNMNTEIYSTDQTKMLRKPPLAKGLPVLGNSLSALSNPLALLISLKNNYDDVVAVLLGGKQYHIIQSPEGCRHVLQENAKNYFKPGTAKLMKRFLGNGLATSNGDLWLRQRRLIQPAFHRKKIEGLAKTINEETAKLIQTWRQRPANREVNINQEILKLTLANINKTMFGTDLNNRTEEIADIINRLLSYASSSITSWIKIPLSIPTPSNLRFLKANREFEKIIYQIIEQRKKENKETSVDLLDLLLCAYDDESKSYMTAQQLRDEITTVFMAGHETTAQTLSWVFYQLAANPTIYAKVKAEAENLGPGEITIDSLQKLSYTKAVIEETMRLYPPVWVMARKSIAADTVSGFHLPAGSTILINVYGMNHNNGYWHSPEMFLPDRFDVTNKETRHPFLFIPFGGGQRLCIGNLFAMLVMQTIVVRLVKEFRFTVPPGFKAVAQPNVTLRAKGGIRLLVDYNISSPKITDHANK